MPVTSHYARSPVFAKPGFKPAQFDRASQLKRSMIGKIKVAVKQLNMCDDDYRQMLLNETGKTSSTELSVAGLEKVLARLTQLGFKAVPKKGGTPQAQHPVAKKARALWISLYHLGAVHNPSEMALEAFAKRQLGCDKLVWARQSDGFKLIEALKNMAARNGWPQHNPQTQKPLSVMQLQQTLCEAVLIRMRRCGLVPQHWQLHHAIFQLCGIENAREHAWTVEDYTHAATALGAKLREFKGQDMGETA